MSTPVIVEAARTPIGRRDGWLSSGLPYTPAATTIDCQGGSGQQTNNFVHRTLVGSDPYDLLDGPVDATATILQRI